MCPSDRVLECSMLVEEAESVTREMCELCYYHSWNLLSNQQKLFSSCHASFFVDLFYYTFPLFGFNRFIL